MNILIKPLQTAQGQRWQVQMDQHGVSFTSESEARTFVATLEKRLHAPHVLPLKRSAS